MLNRLFLYLPLGVCRNSYDIPPSNTFLWLRMTNKVFVMSCWKRILPALACGIWELIYYSLGVAFFQRPCLTFAGIGYTNWRYASYHFFKTELPCAPMVMRVIGYKSGFSSPHLEVYGSQLSPIVEISKIITNWRLSSISRLVRACTKPCHK